MFNTTTHILTNLTAIVATVGLLVVAGCTGGGGGGGDSTGPTVTPEVPGEVDQGARPIHSSWWLPDNTQAIMPGASAWHGSVSQRISSTNADGYFTTRTDGFGQRYDGAPIENATVSVWVVGSLLPWDSRAVMEFGGVAFAERRSPASSAVPRLEIDRIVGFLDYASFGIWREEYLGPPIGSGCCRWVIANHNTTTFVDSTKFFNVGTYRWDGAMVGAVKADPRQTIMGNARLTLSVNALGENEPANTVDITFFNVRNLANGDPISDMLWRINEVGGHCTRGFCLRSGGHVDTALGAGNLIAGSGRIAATWTGPGEANVVGTYENATYLGAFGASR